MGFHKTQLHETTVSMKKIKEKLTQVFKLLQTQQTTWNWEI